MKARQRERTIKRKDVERLRKNRPETSHIICFNIPNFELDYPLDEGLFFQTLCILQ